MGDSCTVGSSLKNPPCKASTTRTLSQRSSIPSGKGSISHFQQSRLTLLFSAWTRADFPDLPFRDVKRLRFRVHSGEFTLSRSNTKVGSHQTEGQLQRRPDSSSSRNQGRRGRKAHPGLGGRLGRGAGRKARDAQDHAPRGGPCACAGTAASLPEVEGLRGESCWVCVPGGRSARGASPSAPDRHVSLRH